MQVRRTEQKMIITVQEAMILKGRLDKVLPRDRHVTSEDGYEIRSLYFDTVADRCYVEKDDGLRVHEKVRARIYGPDSRVIKLECKRKVGEAQVKKTMIIDKVTLDSLVKERYSVLLDSEDPMGVYFYEKLSCGMIPKCIVQYNRLSYCLDTNNIRITLDSNVRSTESTFDLFQDPLNAYPMLDLSRVILEVKYNNFLFDHIKKMLRDLDRSPGACSKYRGGRTFHRHMI